MLQNISRRDFMYASMATVLLSTAGSLPASGAENSAVAGNTSSAGSINQSSNRRRLNVINFIRGLEPRGPVDLFEPVKGQLFLAREHKLPTTWLLQYCAMVQGPFVEFLKKERNPGDEIGFWLEMDQYLVEAAGIQWRSNIPWDYHVQHGFTLGYTQKERMAMIDTAFSRFRQLFGCYPQSCGSWFIDAFSLQYMYEKYGLVASCNCRDQYGTDGYSMWGGYADGGYYPSKFNSFIPAQTKENQIPLPVFRMLGSDPVDQFVHVGEVRSMEPYWTGGRKEWVDWFLKHNYTTSCLSMAYAQIGQENSFGWPGVKNGLGYQYPVVAAMASRGEICIETLAETGKWFASQYDMTPAKATFFPTASDDDKRGAAWYFSARQRLGFYCDNGKFYLRDWRVFDENQQEPFLNSVTRSNLCLYETLPIMDPALWQPVDSIGLQFQQNGQPINYSFTNVSEQGDSVMVIDGQTNGGNLKITCRPDVMEITFPGDSFALMYPECKQNPTRRTVRKDGIDFEYNGYKYGLRIVEGSYDTQKNVFLPNASRKLTIKIA